MFKFINLWFCPCTLSTTNVARKKVRNYDRRTFLFSAPCVTLSRPANGYISGYFGPGSQVRFQCYVGYQRIGAASSICNDGTWSNSAPICKGNDIFSLAMHCHPSAVERFKAIKFILSSMTGICGRPRVLSRGPLKLHGNSFLDGDEVQFSCIANYDLFGSQKSRCVGRRWNTGIPECKGRLSFLTACIVGVF